MSLPVPNLDDRKFQDLVDEAKRLIPTLCPTWTNHNLSDPGVALIELFAWMTEMTLYRLNKVPDAFYVRMLNLLGFEPFPASAARVPLTFWLSSSQAQPVTVPAGTQVGTKGAIGALRVFTTLKDLYISQPTLVAALTSEGGDQYEDVWDDLSIGLEPVRCFPGLKQHDPDDPHLGPDGALYLGFEQSLAGNALRLEVTASSKAKGLGVKPEQPPIIWEVWQGKDWIPATIPPAAPGREPADTTGGLNRPGNILLMIPAEHQPRSLSGITAHWLRARVLPTSPDRPGYKTTPEMSRVVATVIGGTTVAEHSDVITDEMVGISTGKPDQVLRVRNTPVLRRADDEYVKVVVPPASRDESRPGAGTPAREVPAEELATEERWTEKKDFVWSGETDRHVVWDSTTGEIRFGPLIRNPDGTTRQHGAVPPEGAQVFVTKYRWGGGTAGNVGAGTITDLRTAIPYVAGVENLVASSGGVDAETVDNAKRRGPQTIRAGGRAVTATDFERLAVEADPRIARVRCLPPSKAGEPIRLFIVPKVDRTAAPLDIDAYRLPDDMIDRVAAYLDTRRILGTEVVIGVPYYQGVTVAALLVARPARPVDEIHRRALAVLDTYLDPLQGGPDGHGWPFETDLNAASVHQLLAGVEGVDKVDEVLFFEYDLRQKQRRGAGKEIVTLEPESLFMSAKPQVVVVRNAT